MKRPSSTIITGVLALVFAASASLLAYKFLKKHDNKPFQGVSVAAAATEVPVGTKLDSVQVKMVTLPRESLPAGYHTDPQSTLGRVVIRQLSAGDIVTEQKLMPLSASAGSSIMSYIVPQGHRAVTVAVNEVAGVAGFITPNSRVDVVLLSSLSDNREDNVSKIILQNIPVLAIGQGTEQKDGKPTIVPTVTLDLIPEDAEKLIVGTKKGSLQLLLRNVIDVTAVNTPGTTIRHVLGRGDITPQPAKKTLRTERKTVAMAPAPAPYTVEIIKGGTKTKREFPVEQ